MGVFFPFSQSEHFRKNQKGHFQKFEQGKTFQSAVLFKVGWSNTFGYFQDRRGLEASNLIGPAFTSSPGSPLVW